MLMLGAVATAVKLATACDTQFCPLHDLLDRTCHVAAAHQATGQTV